MASLRVLAFDHKGRPVQFDTWLDNLQLYLLSDSKDSVLLFDLASGAAPAPPATADSATRAQWLTRDAAARLAICNHLPLAECAYFGQHRTAQALYDAVVTPYSSLATAALGRLLLPYLFPELSAFAMVEDLVSHLRTSDARYRATVPAKFLDKNQPPMFITLYFIVTRLPDSLRSVRDHFLSLDLTSLTIDLLEQHLLAAKTSAVAVGAARGTPRPPFFEGCSPSPLAPSYASAAAADVPGAEDVGPDSASAERCSGKGKGSRGGGGGSWSGGGGSSGDGGGSGGVGSGGSGGGSGGVGGGGGGSGGSGDSGGGGTGGGRTGAPCSGAGGTGAGGARVDGTGVGGASTGGAGAGGAGAVDPGGAVRPRPYFVPLLQQVLGVPSSTGLTPPLLCPPPDQLQLPLQPASPLTAPSLYTEQFGGLIEHREPASHPVSPVPNSLRVPRSRPPPVPGTHAMDLRPSSVPLRVPLPPPPESSLPVVPDPESDRARAASPTVSRLLATAVTDPSFESAVASALIDELLDFAAACRLDYATALVAESEFASPPSVGGECALGTDVLEERQKDLECLAAAVPCFASMLLALEGDPDAPDIPTPRSYAEAITGPFCSQWQAAMDAEMASWKSAGTCIDEVPPPRANIVDGMWIFREVDYFHTFSPTPKMTTLRVLLHIATQRDYELHSLDLSTSFLQGSLHEEIWLRRPPGFTGSFPIGTQWNLRWPVYGLHQVPREWHDTLRTTLAALGFAPSTADPFLGLQITRDRAWCTITLTHSYMVHQVLQRFGFEFSSPQPTPLSISHALSAPPSDESVEPSGRGPVVLTGHADASWVDDLATQRSSQGYNFSLGSGFVSWWSTRSSSVLSSSCEAEIYAGAMAAQELRWLTYLFTDLGELPRSPPVVYVDNKAMIALC
ncbi:unnamed protein product [Closterium sp. NIES-54]